VDRPHENIGPAFQYNTRLNENGRFSPEIESISSDLLFVLLLNKQFRGNRDLCAEADRERSLE
jgi:hypothetical protein